MREIYVFGPFRLDVGERLLLRGEEPVSLKPKVFDTLVALVRRAGRLVRKEELLQDLWSGTFVTEANLTQNVWLLRRALGEAEDGKPYIETVPRAGYRFLVPAERLGGESPLPQEPVPAPPPVPPPHPRSWRLRLALSAVALAALTLLASLARPWAPDARDGGAPVWRSVLPRDAEARRLYLKGLGRLHGFDALGARALFQEAVAREPGHALAHAALAAAWETLGHDARAEAAARAAWERSRELPRETRLWIEGLRFQTAHRWEESAATFHELCRLAPGQVDYGLELATALGRSGQGQEALDMLARLRTLSPWAGDDPRIDLVEAAAAEGLGLPERVLAASTAAVGKGRRRGARLLVARGLAVQGGALLDLGKPERALAAFREARALSEAAGDRMGVARALHLMALVVSDRGDAMTAEAMYRRALAIRLGEGNRLGASATLNNLAGLVRDRGDLDRASGLYRQALALKREIGDRTGEARVLGNLANLRYDRGEVAEALRLYEQALSIFREHGEAAGTASPIANIALLHVEQGEPARARPFLAELFALAQEKGDRSSLSTALYNQGELLAVQGDLAGALARHQEALAIRREIGRHDKAAESLMSLAAVLRKAGQLAAAEATAREAVRQLEEAARVDDAAWAEATLVRCLVATGRLPEAERRVQRTRAVLARRQALRPWLAFELATAEVLAASGHPAEAVTVLGAALVRAEKAGLAPYALEIRRARLGLAGRVAEASSGESVEAALRPR